MEFIGVKIALWYDGQLLIIQRDDKPGLRYAGLWDFPGGAREGQETPRECVIREVHEELGITLDPTAITYEKTYPAMHDPQHRAYFMTAKISSAQYQGIVFGDEGQGWKLISPEDFMAGDDVVEPLKGRLQDYLDASRSGSSS